MSPNPYLLYQKARMNTISDIKTVQAYLTLNKNSFKIV